MSWRTAKKWADRYRSEGPAGMVDRSSRPHHQPNRTPAPMVRKIVHLRWKQRLGPILIGDRVSMPASTVHAVLVRCRLNRLAHIDRATGEPIRRYEHEHPGDLLHVDVKKLGRVPDGGGWRYVGRKQGLRNRAETPDLSRNKWGKALTGTCYLHTVIDDHSRVAYVEAHHDETKETATEVLRNAVAWFAERGVTVQRILSDNGSCYRSNLWRETCADLGITVKKTRPYRPQTNGKIERFHRTLAEGWAFKKFYNSEVRPPRGSASMGPRVQPPPAPLGHREVLTHHQVEQPGDYARARGRPPTGRHPAPVEASSVDSRAAGGPSRRTGAPDAAPPARRRRIRRA